MSAIHDKLIDFVYAHFNRTGDWPTVRNVDRSLDRYLDPIGGLRRVCDEIGNDRIICESGNPTGLVKLRPRALAEHAVGKQDLDNFLAVARYAAQRYRSSDASPSISVAEFSRDAGLDEAAVKRAFHLALLDGRIFGGGSVNEFQLPEFAGKLEGVASLDDFDHRYQREGFLRVTLILPEPCDRSPKRHSK